MMAPRHEGSGQAGAQQIFHQLPPIFAPDSRILILGTMPSPASRAVQCYYGHPQNRFWKIMAALFAEDPPPSLPAERRDWLIRHRIALWDVLASCRIVGADDGTIRDPEPNALLPLLRQTEVQTIFTTGCKAHSLYNRYCRPETQQEAIPLPSTSPANCRRYTLESLTEAYRAILPYVGR